MAKRIVNISYVPGLPAFPFISGCGVTRKSEWFEPFSLALWSDLCKEGSVVLDVGAYTGIYSIVAGLKGATVIAVEPMGDLVKRFSDNARLNNLEIPLIQKAASDRKGEAMLHFSNVHMSSAASLIKAHSFSTPVLTFRLDELPLQSLRAIKIDVEHAEPLVIAGAMGLIHQFRPTILCEVLKPETLAAIEALLPDYRVVERLDRRNVHLEPKK